MNAHKIKRIPLRKVRIMKKNIVYVVFTTLNNSGCILPYVIGVFYCYDDAKRCANHFSTYHTCSASEVHIEKFIIQ